MTASEPVFDGLSIQEHAGRIAESVRALNHLTMPPGGLRYPSDIYRVVVQLALAAERLPQLCRQLDERVGVLALDDRVVGLDPSAGGTRPLACCGARDHATVLAGALRAAAEHLSRLAYDDKTHDGSEGWFE